MEELMNMYSGLDTLQKVFWVCAVIATLVFIIQFILTMLGMDHTDLDVDFDGSDTMDMGNGINLFSIKNMINFFMGFGWAGICLKDSISSPVLLTLASIVVGGLFVLMFMYIFLKTRKLEHDGTMKIKDCLNRTAQVYIRIPAGGEGKGKVQISLNGSVHEFDAITDEDEIPSGTTIKITEVLEGQILKVVNIQNNLVI